MYRRLLVLAALAVGLAATLAMTAVAATSTAAVTKVVTLTGKAETPPGDLTGKGTARITLNPSIGKVCWKFTITKIDGKPTAAHIHKGRKGTAGPIVVPFGKTYKASGCTSAKKSLVKAIIAKPVAYYVNVHNAKHPAGALRSQL